MPGSVPITSWWSVVRDRSLLQKFGLISLGTIAVIGLILGQMLRSSVERQVLDGAVAEAEVVSRLGLQNSISPSELKNGLSPDRVRALQLALRSDFARIDVVDVVLWNLDGTVVFALNSEQIGESATLSGPLALAASGEALAQIVDVTAGENADPLRQRHGTLVDVYQPVQFGSTDNSQVSGVLRTSVPFGPVAETIAAETRRLYLALVLAFVVLYLVLFRLVANASSELRRRADENEQQARHDALTGLPNRTLFGERLEEILAESRSRPIAVALIDLDRFKEVNDTLGHHHGDLLLVEVGRRLQDGLRACDVVARFGGDEFALVLGDISDGGGATRAVSRLITVLDQPFDIEGISLDIGASVGVALAPDHGSDLSTLLQRADIAMYQAKREGETIAVYRTDFDTTSRQQLALASDLRRSMDSQLVVHYQPKIDLLTKRPRGVEALVRWEHPELGLVAPGAFIPLAERGGMMNDLTRIVLDQSLTQLQRWLSCGLDLHVAVNVSARGLHDPAFFDLICDAVEKHRPPPGGLVLEITETMVAADPDAARSIMARLRDRGVRFSIDDFGTGYSSLAVLRSLDVDELKIDRQFVRDLAHPEGLAIVEYSVHLGHMLGLTVLAEGVEGPDEPPILQRLGCDLVQGYWYAHPMPADEIARWLESTNDESSLAFLGGGPLGSSSED